MPRPDHKFRTGSAHAASSFFTKFTRLLTSYRRIKAGSNGFSRWHTVSGCSRVGTLFLRVGQEYGEH
jgi:hypothetical protein